MVIALDPRGVEIARVYVIDPRIIRAESADVDGDNADEILLDLGALGLFMWNNAPAIQISAMNLE